jgi:hypothetical protein
MRSADSVERLRAAVRGSTLITWVRAGFTRSCAEAAGVVRDLLHDPGASGDALSVQGADERELDDVVRTVTSSRLYLLFAWPVRRIVSAWQTARVRNIVNAGRREVEALDAAQACRLAGLALLAAVLTDGLVRRFDPRPASGIRLWLWSALLATAVLMIAAAPQLVVAWRGRRFNR